MREQDRSLPKAAHKASSFQPSPKEWGVVAWSYENKQCAGRYTDTLPESAATWFPLQTATATMGVLALNILARVLFRKKLVLLDVQHPVGLRAPFLTIR